MEPCSCHNYVISCGGEQEIDLEAMFERLSKKLPKRKKHFDELYINNTVITELGENITKDITFHTIFIDSAQNLKRIDKNAFKGTADNVKVFVLKKCQNFDSLELFDVLNGFPKMETIHVGNTKLTGIPSNAFRTLPNIYSIAFYGESIKTIGEKAFHDLKTIRFIDIVNTSLSYIPDNVFVFEKSERKVGICLFYNQLEGNGFSAGALAHIGRPAEFHFMGHLESENSDKIKFLDQNSFEPFFKADPHNTVVFKYEVLDCNDCRNKWLKTTPEYGNRVTPLKCSNGIKFDSQANFAKCV